MNSFCKVCGFVDEAYDENLLIHHEDTPKHMCNLILLNYNNNKSHFSKNRHGVKIFGHAKSLSTETAYARKVENCNHHKIQIVVKPQQQVKFTFDISNDMKKEDLFIIGVQLAHPQPQFLMKENPFIFGEEPTIIAKKTSLKGKVCILFNAADIGQYEMPIMFTLFRKSDNKNLIFIREMVVLVQEHIETYTSIKYPYTNQVWEKAPVYVSSTSQPSCSNYTVPKLLKTLLPLGLEETSLEGLNLPTEEREQLGLLMNSTKMIFDEGYSKRNYVAFFHHLLWWEEVIAKINLRNYNMFGVMLVKKDEFFVLEVPGLAEKRPSLLRGDRVYVRPQGAPDYMFESTIKHIEDNTVLLAGMDSSFLMLYYPESLFDVRFMMSRVPKERMHDAVHKLFTSKQDSRVFPQMNLKKVPLQKITRFHNDRIASNPEQRSAVTHIVSGTHGLAPYIVYGPPGTGKTMTIVEAITQLVVRNPRNRVLVCTDSNMAADHIALMLLQYNKQLNITNFLFRANSQCREWTVMPPALAPVSNGISYETFYSVGNAQVATYRILVTTLLHAAKYASPRSQASQKLVMTHLFVDEAAQASEPAVLVPITGLLAPNGKLVLAGDPQQLGPVCISRDAKERGLGCSLLERLCTTYSNMYESNPNYMTMLVQNFRSDPDILAIPNELFYGNNLKAFAPSDPLSKISILGLPGGKSAVVFHAVNSREQRMGNAPSYFNERELEMLKRYTQALLEDYSVLPKDIGVIAPYIRQVYKMKNWLKSINQPDIEVGTVESFQGKEKRVILVSTVRANCRLLEYDAKYSLGFLVDDKRYNVTLTRAKAKLIIIGSPSCLTRDEKWRKYMDFCKEKDSYYGLESQQIERSTSLLVEIAKTRFDRCRLSDELKD
ncbi:putative helicase mov-10-B.1 [Pieris brassicae]|uniref:putative helicase mov-10-B.1 n=1 Tax=Pieris brassicae TaxID=7116 RepID=UPI001E66169D|nr:putative helicase mov-10-B.1 [Pieris brassicae]